MCGCLVAFVSLLAFVYCDGVWGFGACGFTLVILGIVLQVAYCVGQVVGFGCGFRGFVVRRLFWLARVAVSLVCFLVWYFGILVVWHIWLGACVAWLFRWFLGFGSFYGWWYAVAFSGGFFIEFVFGFWLVVCLDGLGLGLRWLFWNTVGCRLLLIVGW